MQIQIIGNILSPSEVANQALLVDHATQSMRVVGPLSIYNARYGKRADQVGFHSSIVTYDLMEEARSVRLGLDPLDVSDWARSIRALVDTCPDEWIQFPSASLVREVLDRASEHVAVKGDEVDNMLANVFGF